MIQVAVVDVFPEVVPDGGARHRQRADVHRDALALRNQLAVACPVSRWKSPGWS